MQETCRLKDEVQELRSRMAELEAALASLRDDHTKLAAQYKARKKVGTWEVWKFKPSKPGWKFSLLHDDSFHKRISLLGGGGGGILYLSLAIPASPST